MSGSGVRRIEVSERESPVFGGTQFAAVGPYERLHGTLFGELDPTHPLNAGIVNLDRAARNTHGNVEYLSDFRILKPLDLDRGNGCLVYDVPNRGNQPIMPRLNGAPDGGHHEHAGNGFLMRRGFTVVWSGWQGDVPPGNDRLTARFPIMPGITGMVREEFIAEDTGLLGDTNIEELSEERFVGTLVYPVADPNGATLTVRQREADPRVTPAGLAWRLVDDRHVEITRPTAPALTAARSTSSSTAPATRSSWASALPRSATSFRSCATTRQTIRWRRRSARGSGARSVSASRRAAACFAISCISGSTRILPVARCSTAFFRSSRARVAPASTGGLRKPAAIRASMRTIPTATTSSRSAIRR